MPTETNSQKPAVQAPAQVPVEVTKTPLPEAPKPVPVPKGIVQEPGKDYDQHRGVGGDYVIDEKTGHRVPAYKK